MVKENGMVMMTEKELERMETEHEQTKMDYECRIELLQKAILELTNKSNAVQGVRVPKIDFLAIYQKALDDMFNKLDNGSDEDNDIYGYDITVHWHGIYCNCGDGATPSNHIIPGIESCADEDPTEY